MRSRRRQSALTMIELMLALFISLVVVFALGRLILQNQRSWEWGRDKTVLQQNVTESLEWMARSVRGARVVEVVSDEEFKTYDETGALVHTYQRVDLGGGRYRIHEDGSDLVDRDCTDFEVTPDNDTSSVTLVLELKDKAQNRVAGTTRAAIRNRSYEF